ncbi:MAG: beta-lactamase family protein [Ferruginibacter sp.]|nr:beta-lactamase family protein [Chitinophagaceae bacterium]
MKRLSLFLLAVTHTLFSISQTGPIPVKIKTTVLQPAKPESAGFSNERLQRIDDNINKWIADGRLNGSVALIIRNGKIIYHKAFGYDDPEKTKPVRTDNIFRIASQTKAITSAAIMILYEEGKFLLDDPLSRYIPEFAKQQVLDKFDEKDSSYTTVPAKSEVTIRQLLTHTSGISYAQIGSKESNAIFAKANITAGIGVEKGRILAVDMKRTGKMPLAHQPGEKFTYGLNTDVLGYLVEVISGMSLDQFFRQRIFEPLGMTDTWFYLPASKQNRLVTLYEEVDKKLVKRTEVKQNGIFDINYPNSGGTYFSGGGGLSSTALDYAIFLQMILNGGEYNGKRILSRHSVRMMTMNQIGEISRGANKFGLGFGITTEKGSSILPTPEGIFEWGGAFATTYWADPKEKIIGIFYRQLWGSTFGEIANKFKVLVYSALND